MRAGWLASCLRRRGGICLQRLVGGWADGGRAEWRAVGARMVASSPRSLRARAFWCPPKRVIDPLLMHPKLVGPKLMDRPAGRWSKQGIGHAAWVHKMLCAGRRAGGHGWRSVHGETRVSRVREEVSSLVIARVPCACVGRVACRVVGVRVACGRSRTRAPCMPAAASSSVSSGTAPFM